MAPVLVLPGAIGLGKHCRSGFFPKRLTVSDVARADLIGRATITKATIAFTGWSRVHWLAGGGSAVPPVTERITHMGKTKDESRSGGSRTL
jgi:hypothetical protein